MKTVSTGYSLVIYGSYQELVVGLFKGPQLIYSVYRENIRLSAHLLQVLDEVLESTQLQLHDLSYLAVCQGPGSFSSLRALLASMNGIAAASGLPLVGCDGLIAVSTLMSGKLPAQECITLVVMNAYNNEFFYRIEQLGPVVVPTLRVPMGYGSVEHIKGIMQSAGHPVYVAGNSASVFLGMVDQLSGQEVSYTPVELIEALALQARHKVGAGEVMSSLQPSHLKNLQFKKLSNE